MQPVLSSSVSNQLEVRRVSTLCRSLLGVNRTVSTRVKLVHSVPSKRHGGLLVSSELPVVVHKRSSPSVLNNKLALSIDNNVLSLFSPASVVDVDVGVVVLDSKTRLSLLLIELHVLALDLNRLVMELGTGSKSSQLVLEPLGLRVVGALVVLVGVVLVVSTPVSVSSLGGYGCGECKNGKDGTEFHVGVTVIITEYEDSLIYYINIYFFVRNERLSSEVGGRRVVVLHLPEPVEAS